ncbi:MAG TPA: hypothetical protein VN605_14920, partial [Thermoanaerobaculia bacterium]|nr:hypothetical protein [Thermoanaerobaculia bacterium]
MTTSTIFDHLGRVFETRSAMPTETNLQRTNYFPNGWKESESSVVSDRTTDSQLPKTTYRYDPFGRPVVVTHADSRGANIANPPESGWDRRTRYQYQGRRETITTIDGFGAPGHNMRISDQMFDVFGRLIKIGEPSYLPDDMGTGIPDNVTRYGYDMSDHLTEVGIGADDNPRMTFHYDGRGNMILEKTPELDAPIVQAYDSRGNMTESYYGNRTDRTPFDLSYVYDFAERPLSVIKALGREPLKDLEYNTSTASVGARGKLAAAERHNVVPSSSGTNQTHDVTVRQTYVYSGSTGRITSRTDEATDSTGLADDTFSARTNFTYDSLGNLSTLGYPAPFGSTTCPSCPQRSVTFGYHPTGQLNKVTDDRAHSYADSYSYFANGMFQKIARGGAAGSDEQGYDLSGIARPKSITARSNAPLWTTGIYSYDAAGNITAIGADMFRYDGVSRLMTALYPASGSNFSYYKQYIYDRFGNIVLGSDGNEGSPTGWIDSTRNRMTNYSYDIAGNVISM